MVLYKGIKYGAFAGFLATWAISSAIVAAELILGLRISTFYSIIGISLGSNDMVSAGYIGFGLHILVGTLIGALLGVIGIRWKKFTCSTLSDQQQYPCVCHLLVQHIAGVERVAPGADADRPCRGRAPPVPAGRRGCRRRCRPR